MKYMSEDNKKYSIIDKNVNDWLNDMRSIGEHGFCIEKFVADFIVEDLSRYKVGDKLTVDGTTIEITSLGKNCYKDCPYFKKDKKSCHLKDGVAFAK